MSFIVLGVEEGITSVALAMRHVAEVVGASSLGDSKSEGEVDEVDPIAADDEGTIGVDGVDPIAAVDEDTIGVDEVDPIVTVDEDTIGVDDVSTPSCLTGARIEGRKIPYLLT